MQVDGIKQQYEDALKLAESGNYESALEAIQKYLQISPEDGKAFNDAGTTLFCLKRGKEAIAYFEKAQTLCQGDEKAQVDWNLCETYIQEGYPEKALAMFPEMHQERVLNPDIMNRTAESFLDKNDLGRAMETIKLSLKLSPEQDVLNPMLQVIRSHRKPITVIAAENSLCGQLLVKSLDVLIPTKYYIAHQVNEDTVRDSGIVVFIGISKSLIQTSQYRSQNKIVVVLEERDFHHPLISEIDFSAVNVVVACAPTETIPDLREQIGATRIVVAENVPEVDPFPLYEKKCGKRIAAIGPWTLRNNPMFLLQSFQKLHYIDSSYRLYLAGWFEDAGLERYMNNMIEAMDLENEVIFDYSVKNISKWLKDKHYIVSTSVDSSALGGIWVGATCGLKPVVHRFAGVQESFDETFVFDYAEGFCERILDKTYEPASYRQLASQHFEQAGLLKQIHSVLSNLEKEMCVQTQQSVSVPEISPSHQTNHSVNKTAQEVLDNSKTFVEMLPSQELVGSAEMKLNV